MNSLVIRAESSADYGEIDRLLVAAFADDPHSLHNEHHIVRDLRLEGELTVSLVAELDKEIVGQLALSPVEICDGTVVCKLTHNWYGLGPLAVAPAWQRRGIGSQLMAAGITALHSLNAGGCVVLGDPDYYCRFGFKPYATLQLPGVPAAYFQARLLAGELPSGAVRYASAFDVSE